MAKTRLGIMVGEASGALGATVFSHNRYGTYVRLRAVPVQPNSEYQLNAKETLTKYSQAWSALTDAQRKSWSTWAATNPIIDNLGDKRILTGHVAFIMLNARLRQDEDPQISIPPITAPPTALTSMTPTYTAATDLLSIAFAPSPLGENNALYIWVAVVESTSRKYVKNLYKRLGVTSKNTTTPYEADSVPLRFGDVQVGQIVHVKIAVLDRVSGLISQPRAASVAAT